MVDDITSRKEVEAELFRRANFDMLTGIANRSSFYLQLQRIVAQSKRNHKLMALMYFDIDQFKAVNDTYGHDVGDQVIKEFAARVKSALRSSDLLARIGGDEFVLLIEDAGGVPEIEHVALKIQSLMTSPFVVQQAELQISTSIGIAIYEPEMSVDQWVKRAGRNGYRLADASTT